MNHVTAKLPAARRPVLAAALCSAALVLAACSAAADAPSRPSASAGTVESRALPASVADLPLTDQRGHVVDLASLRGKTVVLVPFLTLCQEMCPFDTGNLLQVQRALNDAHAESKVALMEVSVDPARDTPARLAAYAHLTGATWELVTEPPSTLTALEHYFGWYAQEVPEASPPGIDWWTHQPLAYDVDHSDGYTIVDPVGVVRFATGASPDYSGTLNSSLSKLLDSQGRGYLRSPPQPGWTSSAMLASLGWMLHVSLPQPTS